MARRHAASTAIDARMNCPPKATQPDPFIGSLKVQASPALNTNARPMSMMLSVVGPTEFGAKTPTIGNS
jgi:hypothetical protein